MDVLTRLARAYKAHNNGDAGNFSVHMPLAIQGLESVVAEMESELKSQRRRHSDQSRPNMEARLTKWLQELKGGEIL